MPNLQISVGPSQERPRERQRRSGYHIDNRWIRNYKRHKKAFSLFNLVQLVIFVVLINKYYPQLSRVNSPDMKTWVWVNLCTYVAQIVFDAATVKWVSTSNIKFFRRTNVLLSLYIMILAVGGMVLVEQSARSNELGKESK